MDKNYTVEKKNIELTEKGKQELIEWALNYYDQQNEEPEEVEIVDLNIPVEQQQLETTLKKFEKIIESIDKKLGLTKGIEIENIKRGAVSDSIYKLSLVTPMMGIVIGGIVSLIASNGLFLIPTVAISFAQEITLGIISLIKDRKLSKEKLKEKLNKQFLKKAKKARKAGVDLDIEFSEDEYTLFFLKKLYNELLVQNESIKNVLKAGV